MSGVFRNNIKNFFVFVSIFVFVSLVPTQVITMERYGLVILFYLTVASLLLYVFRSTYTSIFQKTRWYEFVGLISLSLIVHGLVSYFIITYVERPDWIFSDRGTSFLLMNNYYVWAKTTGRTSSTTFDNLANYQAVCKRTNIKADHLFFPHSFWFNTYLPNIKNRLSHWATFYRRSNGIVSIISILAVTNAKWVHL
jgi:hypothetical protein